MYYILEPEVVSSRLVALVGSLMWLWAVAFGPFSTQTICSILWQCAPQLNNNQCKKQSLFAFKVNFIGCALAFVLFLSSVKNGMHKYPNLALPCGFPDRLLVFQSVCQTLLEGQWCPSIVLVVWWDIARLMGFIAADTCRSSWEKSELLCRSTFKAVRLTA